MSLEPPGILVEKSGQLLQHFQHLQHQYLVQLKLEPQLAIASMEESGILCNLTASDHHDKQRIDTNETEDGRSEEEMMQLTSSADSKDPHKSRAHPSSSSSLFTVKSQIEVIPCKICGDKSSGIHYGIITCEGCKGFFRRSQAGHVMYQCPREQSCAIDRVNRNRCQYCRLQKCIALGMSRDAVKFGRMSKKQRERVEDEANFHKRRLSSLPSDSSPPHPSDAGNSPSNNNVSEQSTNSDEGGASSVAADVVRYVPSYNVPDSLQPLLGQYSPLTGSPIVIGGTVRNGSFRNQVKASPSDGITINLALLAKAIADAYTLTCACSSDQVKRLRGLKVSEEQLSVYQQMNHEEVWQETAEKLTDAVQQIIEFAKLVPGFINLLQDDQIMLLKGGSFEIALLRFCQVFDPGTNSVLFGSSFVPLSVFSSVLNDEESGLMNSIIEFGRQVIDLGLSHVELALLCAVVLINPNRPGVKNAPMIQKLNERIDASLKLELSTSQQTGVDIRPMLAEKIAELQLLSFRHMDMLARFKDCFPYIEFPALHKELFSQEGVDGP